MSDFATTDFFRDEDLLREPYPYFDFLRGQCPVYREGQHGVEIGRASCRERV